MNEKNINPADLDEPCLVNGKWVVKEQLYPESRGYYPHYFESHEKAEEFIDECKLFYRADPDKILKVDFRKLTPSVMLERLSKDYADCKTAFVIIWPEDGSLPEYFTNSNDYPVILMRLQEFIHKWYNGDFETVDN